MKRILVTGGAGFIGSHLVTALLAQGHDVICLDNYFTGKKQNFAAHNGKANFEAIRHDITQPLQLEIDEVYNLACPASPVHYQHDPIKTSKTCYIGTLNMLELCQRQSAKFLQASTSEIYGDPLQHPQKEEYWGNVNSIGPRSCYDEGKRVAETLCSDFHHHYGLDTRIARIFNTYGPRMALNDGRVVSNFIVQALKNEPITIYGQGSQTRSFCFVDDLVDGLIKLMNNPHIGGSPVNLGNPSEMTIKQLAETIIRLTNSNSEIVQLPLPQDDPVKRQPNIEKAQNILGWQPHVKLENGLIQTISYFKNELAQETRIESYSEKRVKRFYENLNQRLSETQQL